MFEFKFLSKLNPFYLHWSQNNLNELEKLLKLNTFCRSDDNFDENNYQFSGNSVSIGFNSIQHLKVNWRLNWMAKLCDIVRIYLIG